MSLVLFSYEGQCLIFFFGCACAFRVCGPARWRGLGPTRKPYPLLLPCAFLLSQGKSPHAKEKKWGVKGSEFPLDLLLDAPSVPSPCHSALRHLKGIKTLNVLISCTLYIMLVKLKKKRNLTRHCN